jgi:ABC-2 type transport system permease protein
MGRYLRLLSLQVRASLLVALQYRLEFLVDGLSGLFWAATTFVPLFVVFDRRTNVGGWTFGESLLVLGFFQLLKSLLEGAVNPSLLKVVEQVRKGTFDFVLLKPADAQFLVSTTKFVPSASIGAAGGLGLLAWGFVQLGRLPPPGAVAASLLLLASAVALLYALWIAVAGLAFTAVRVDNLSYLFTSVFDAARWPSSVFRGALGFVFTWVVPLSLMTTVPAAALVGRLSWSMGLGAVALSVGFSVVARRLWRRSLAKYASASS